MLLNWNYTTKISPWQHGFSSLSKLNVKTPSKPVPKVRRKLGKFWYNLRNYSPSNLVWRGQQYNLPLEWRLLV